MPNQRDISITPEMYASPAFKALQSGAVRLLLELHWRHDGTNNGHITLPVRAAAKIAHASIPTARKMLASLCAGGFAAETFKGGIATSLPSRWSVTCDYQ